LGLYVTMCLLQVVLRGSARGPHAAHPVHGTGHQTHAHARLSLHGMCTPLSEVIEVFAVCSLCINFYPDLKNSLSYLTVI